MTGAVGVTGVVPGTPCRASSAFGASDPIALTASEIPVTRSAVAQWSPAEISLPNGHITLSHGSASPSPAAFHFEPLQSDARSYQRCQ
jgi:hypothetical protein